MNKVLWPFIVTCPNNKCTGRSGIHIPLKEVPVVKQFGCFTIHCPHCLVPLLQCENCFSMIEDSSSSLRQRHVNDLMSIICKKCGFLNVVDQFVRESLELPRLSPISSDRLRILQRCVSELLYHQKKVTEFTFLSNCFHNEGPAKFPSEYESQEDSDKTNSYSSPHREDLPTPISKKRGAYIRKRKYNSDNEMETNISKDKMLLPNNKKQRTEYHTLTSFEIQKQQNQQQRQQQQPPSQQSQQLQQQQQRQRQRQQLPSQQSQQSQQQRQQLPSQQSQQSQQQRQQLPSQQSQQQRQQQQQSQQSQQQQQPPSQQLPQQQQQQDENNENIDKISLNNLQKEFVESFINTNWDLRETLKFYELQLKNIRDSEIRLSDLKEVLSFTWHIHCLDFNTTHLNILRLYYQDQSDEYNQFIERAADFLNKRTKLIDLKLECERTLLAFNRTPFIDLGATIPFNDKESSLNILMTHILKQRYETLRNFLCGLSTPFFELLGFITKELKSLYLQLLSTPLTPLSTRNQSLRSIVAPPLFNFQAPNSEEIDRLLEQENCVEQLKEKTRLLRDLYKSVSACLV